MENRILKKGRYKTMATKIAKTIKTTTPKRLNTTPQRIDNYDLYLKNKERANSKRIDNYDLYLKNRKKVESPRTFTTTKPSPVKTRVTKK
jgi:hypothetical protein